jgi:hypothetical protein
MRTLEVVHENAQRHDNFVTVEHNLVKT